MLFWICSLDWSNSSNIKQAVALCKCIFLLHPSTPLSLTRVGLQGHNFITTTYCHQFLFFFPLQLYVTFLLSAVQNAHNHSVHMIYTLFFHLVLLKMKKGERICYKIKLLTNYCQVMLWATCNLKKKYEWLNQNLLTSRKTINYDRKLKINLKQTTTVCRTQNQGWSVLTLKWNFICSLT